MYKQLSRLPNKLIVIFNFYYLHRYPQVTRPVRPETQSALEKDLQKDQRRGSRILRRIMKSNCTPIRFHIPHIINTLRFLGFVQFDFGDPPRSWDPDRCAFIARFSNFKA